MQIELEVNNKTLILRGSDNGGVDLCHWIDIKDKSGTPIPTLVPFRYYPSLSSALQRVMEMKITTRDSSTLKELMVIIEEERQWLKKQLGV